MTSEELLEKAKALNDDEKYQEVVDLLPDELLNELQNANLYAEKAMACWRLENAELCEINADNALKIDPKNAKALNYKGNALAQQKQYINAEAFYQKSIETNSEYFHPYNGLANIYYLLSRYHIAEEFYNKAIKIDPELYYPYYGLGLVFTNLKEYDKAVKSYKIAMKKSPDDPDVHYNLANAYYEKKEFEHAAKHYRIYQSLTNNEQNVFTSIAKTRLEQIRKITESTFYEHINKIVVKIKTILLYQENCVTHYTAFSTARILLNKESLFRLSEGTFLNDTSEGRQLFEYLPALNKASAHPDRAEAKPFAAKPFIGSFVSQEQHDNLTLWRMYGKENEEEAKGCAITIQREQFLSALKTALFEGKKSEGSTNVDRELSFYRVAYLKSDDSFVVPGLATEEEEKLPGLMRELHQNVTDFIKSDYTQEQKKNIEELLNSIAYLFKTYAYQYENEVRLVVDGNLFQEKQVDNALTPPKVYINLVGVRPFVAKITLGPRVPKAEEWAAAFHYSLNKDGLNPEIYISHLPFK